MAEIRECDNKSNDFVVKRYYADKRSFRYTIFANLGGMK